MLIPPFERGAPSQQDERAQWALSCSLFPVLLSFGAKVKLSWDWLACS